MAPGMTSTAEQLPSESLLDAYKKFYINLRIRQAKICFSLAMFLVPACIGLDYFVYPNLAWPMFVARLWSDVAMLPFFFLLFRPCAHRIVRYIDSAPLISATVAICYMIYRAEGALSPYYAGLNIVIAAAILLVPYTLAEACAICGFVITSYIVACVMQHHAQPDTHLPESVLPALNTMVNNFYFLAMTALIACTSNHFSSVRRFHEFRLRHELDENNIQLAQTNQKLDENNIQLAQTIQKLKETEVQLVQSEKMNAIGKLSAGLLHEVNNPLNFTFMALQVAEQDAQDRPDLKEALADINQGMSRIRTVISDLRAFAYPSQSTVEQEFNLEEAFVTAKRLTSQEMKEIPINADAIKGVKCMGTNTQIVHVFMNLFINSAHAIRSKGGVKEPLIKIATVEKNGRLFISVRDNGCGVPAANFSRLFEPFFTTKQPGEGTGLGLSICHTIVKNHGGEMIVASELGQWTEFTFDLALPKAGEKRVAA
jgi:two-component system sensor histidine kinase PhcS